ncbi:MAG TPA: YoaK family protein [Terracidiphilus sp.]|nr:YoaK family protein [Terracidiphilus sp.]
MRESERDLLLIVLAVSAGSADGWGYFGLGHAFVANMTGNTVLVAMSLLGYQSDLAQRAIAMGCYVLGVVLAALLTRQVRQGTTWPRQVSATLLLESILLIGAEIAWIAVLHHSAHAAIFPGQAHNLLLGAVAVAIGMQSGAMLQLRIPGVVTTYITGTWTSLSSGVVRLASGKRSGPSRKNLAFEERLLLQGVVLVFYFFSAMLSGWVLKNLPAVVGAIPAASVLVVAVFGLSRPGDAGASSIA